MPDEQSRPEDEHAQLGGALEGRLQRYFCIDDEECQAFSMVSSEAKVLSRVPKRVRVMGEEVDGWIVELIVPATDGVVRVDPLEESGKI